MRADSSAVVHEAVGVEWVRRVGRVEVVDRPPLVHQSFRGRADLRQHEGVQQLGLEGMPTRLLRCTPSRLTTWRDCPRRYRMTYLDRPAPPRGQPWAHNTVGAAVHLALARWWALPLPRRTPAAGWSLVDTGWQDDGFADQAQSQRWRERSADDVEHYVAGWRERSADDVEHYVAALDPADEPVGVERTVSVTTPGLVVSGRVDRLDARADGVVVVDYKTGRHVPDEADARGSLALALYAVAAERTLRQRCTRVELHHLRAGTVAAVDHTAQSLVGHVERAEALGAGAVTATDALEQGGDARALFPARPGAQCGWCDHNRSCDAAAVPLHQPWAGLAEEPAA